MTALSVTGHRLSLLGSRLMCEQTGCPMMGEVLSGVAGTFTAGDVADIVALHVEAAHSRPATRRPAARRPSESDEHRH